MLYNTDEIKEEITVKVGEVLTILEEKLIDIMLVQLGDFWKYKLERCETAHGDYLDGAKYFNNGGFTRLANKDPHILIEPKASVIKVFGYVFNVESSKGGDDGRETIRYLDSFAPIPTTIRFKNNGKTYSFQGGLGLAKTEIKDGKVYLPLRAYPYITNQIAWTICTNRNLKDRAYALGKLLYEDPQTTHHESYKSEVNTRYSTEINT
mgnify:CR=1 FL=1